MESMTGMVTMLRSVVPLTIETDISTSRSYFAANIDTIAATGAAAGMTIAIISVRSSDARSGQSAAIARAGQSRSLTATARCADGLRSAAENFAPAR